MSRIACVLLLTLSSVPVRGADLPPGAVARLGDPSFRAGSRVERIALSPDGKQYATVRRGTEGNVLVAVCDAATGRVLRECEQNRQLFGGLVWAPGGAHAVTIRAEPEQKDKIGKVFPDDFRVWNFADLKSDPPPALPVFPSLHLPGRVSAEEPSQSPRYTDFRFGGAGTRVAARWKSADGKKHAIHVLELKPTATAAKLTQCGTIDLGAEGIDEFLISADGKTVVTFRKLESARDERTEQYAATTWDLSGKPSKPVRVETYPATSVRETPRLMLTPHARALALFAEDADGWGFDLFDFATHKRRKLARWKHPPADTSDRSAGEYGGFAFSADGSLLIVATDGKTLVIDVEAGKELGKLEGHADTPIAVAISADGAVIATADWHGLVRLWNTKDLTPRGDAQGHRAPVQHAELSPDGKRLLTWAEDETVRLWDLATGQELRAFTGASGVRAWDQPTFTPDGTAIFYSTSKQLVSRDLLSGLEVPLPGDMKELKPSFVAFAPDGKSVLTWSGSGELIEVWDWPGGKKRFTIDAVHTGAAGFSADSKAVYLDASSRGWDTATGKELPLAPWPEQEGHQLRSLRSGAPLVFDGDEDRPRRVLQYGTARPVPTPLLDKVREDGHFWPDSGVAFLPNYRQFASVFDFENEKAVLCETVTGQERQRLGGHRGEVRVLGFTPDGTKLLTAGGDHTVLVWDVRLQSVPLPDALKKETNAAKLWDQLATGKADVAYLAMARLSREPDAAVKMAKLRLKPSAKGDPETEAGKVADARGIELLEALNTDESRGLLKELAAGHATAFRTQEAKRATARNTR